MPLLIVASLWYLFVTTVLSIGQFYSSATSRVDRCAIRLRHPIQRLRRDLKGVAMRMRPKRRSGGAMSAPMVEAKGVTKSYGALQVLKGVDLTVESGEVTCLIGPSGSGKSTLPSLHQPPRAT